MQAFYYLKDLMIKMAIKKLYKKAFKIVLHFFKVVI